MSGAASHLGRNLALLIGRPGEAARLCAMGRDLRGLTLVALGSIVIGSSAFGALLGSTRSSVQAFYAGAKLPVAWLITLAVCAPAYYAVAALLGRPLRLRSVCAAVLIATGRASAVLLALLPVLWLALCFSSESGADYHRIIGLAIVLYGLAGFAALGSMARVFAGKALLVTFAAALFLLVGGQAAWTLRPFVGRPADDQVPFLRAPEGTFVGTLPRALQSASGYYAREAPHASRKGGSFE